MTSPLNQEFLLYRQVILIHFSLNEIVETLLTNIVLFYLTYQQLVLYKTKDLGHIVFRQ